MALGKNPCEHSPEYSTILSQILTDSTRLSPPKIGTNPCPRRMSRRCERTLQRQLDPCSRDLPVANSVVATQMRRTCSSQTFGSRSSAPTIRVLRGSRLRTTLTTYLLSQSASAVNSGTRKGCVRYNGHHIICICCSTTGPLDFTYMVSRM